MSPCIWAVFSLNALQNSMMLTECCPSAGPTGGAGLAAPAGICSLMKPATFFAMVLVSPRVVQRSRVATSHDRWVLRGRLALLAELELGDVVERQLERGLASEDADE